jgi:asparagine synthase (glutamine-hydrolysing)
MCGIAGVLCGDPLHAETGVRTMLSVLSRRGPDGEGIERWNDAVLGHRRLAIFDLTEAGRQPMLSPDGRIGVTFNGAIYNFKELRSQLESAGYVFTTRTDTEVLVHGYDAWGIDALVAKLHGMFAFALWDDRSATLYLVRDRLGVKPLLYAQRSGAFAFASTARALQRAGFAGEIDPQAVADYLEFGFVPDERSIFCGVHKLPAGHIAQWRNGTLSMRQYWKRGAPTDTKIRFEDAVDEAERLLLRAVELRLEADVPVGALLSGGIDSSLVCWAIRRLGGDITAFTIATPGDVYDESADARATAAELGIRHRVLPIDAHTAPSIGDLTAAFGEPFACASALGMIAISQAVREHATVLLTGDGGDDVFLGYPRHLHYYSAQRLARALPPFSTAAWNAGRRFMPRTGVLRRAVHFVDYATGGLGAVAAANDGLPYYAAHAMFGDRLRDASVAHRGYPKSVYAGRQLLDEFIQFETRTRFVSEYMTKVDGATMYHALEARAPMLDQKLWEFVSSLPYSLRLRGGQLKAILREIARRRIGPRVAFGEKRGFGVPVQRWISGPRRGEVEQIFSDSVLERDGWIDAKAVLAALRALREGQTAPQQLWYLYVLEEWMRRAKSAEPSTAPAAAAS